MTAPSDDPAVVPTASFVWTSKTGSGALALVAIWDGHCVERVLEAGSSLLVGRAHECDVRIDHKSVSRHHARIYVGERVEVEDLGSSNGTRVGGLPLGRGDRSVIGPGALIGVGIATLVVQGHSGGARAAGASPQRKARLPWPRQGVMAQVCDLIEVLSESELSVLFLGETGVGKQVAALALHETSARREGPFVSVNCAALPEPLIESELFGHERGAFTGADSAKPGLLESASGGSVLLDEIGELPLGTQAKLLTAVESGELRRVGGVQPRRIDVRYISATNRDLVRAVDEGTFRRDLFYRLAGMPIEIPPLRQRQDEMVLLAKSFLAEAAERQRVRVPALSDGAEKKLRSHGFPGNVRELRNVIQRAFALARGGDVEVAHLALGAPVTSASQTSGLKGSVRALERQRIVDALAQTGGNQTAAATLLGIGRRTLIDKMEAFGISGPRKAR
ncbi:MAG: sigma 54-interacting transcriptional regulator [Polyangiaceae bacterium]|nr:sigma 54-interacting transcriptional regulator [Polyangiaceae bacterium]MCK6537589.1 sigma 54-interacting transcriptional regulator [Polyangiaceae bacterium]